MENIVEQLREHAQKHNLKELALQSCREYLESYQNEYPEEFAQLFKIPLEELQVVWRQHYLVFEDNVRSWPRIMTVIRIGEKKNHWVDDVHLRAEYTLETLLDGSINDDWFDPMNLIEEDE